MLHFCCTASELTEAQTQIVCTFAASQAKMQQLGIIEKKFTIGDRLSGSEDITGTVEGRVFDIRARLGDGVRKPLNSRKFAALLTEKAREMGMTLTFDSSWVSRTEKGRRERGLTVDEIAVLAAVDPEDRGRAWVAWNGRQADRLAYLSELRAAEMAVLVLRSQQRHDEADQALQRVEEAARRFFNSITENAGAVEQYVATTVRTLAGPAEDSATASPENDAIAEGS